MEEEDGVMEEEEATSDGVLEGAGEGLVRSV